MQDIVQRELDRLQAEHSKGQDELQRLRRQLTDTETIVAQIVGGIATLQKVLKDAEPVTITGELVQTTGD